MRQAKYDGKVNINHNSTRENTQSKGCKSNRNIKPHLKHTYVMLLSSMNAPEFCENIILKVEYLSNRIAFGPGFTCFNLLEETKPECTLILCKLYFET